MSKNTSVFKIQVLSTFTIKCWGDLMIFQFFSAIRQKKKKTAEDSAETFVYCVGNGNGLGIPQQFTKGSVIHYFKGYLSYKRTTCQNVSFDALVKIFFILLERYSRYSSFCIFNIPWFTKSMRSWWVLVHEAGCIFEYIFWNTTHKVTKLGQLIDICKGNNFQESFEEFRGLGLSSRSFSI